ncbi:MAG: glycerophosphodiester phosphodiesterase [Halanaerobiales bacterium]
MIKFKPLIIGHRGAMGSAPENTAFSFEKALKCGADGVEFDIHMTKDSHLIVIHDEKLDRTTDGKGLINEHTLEELKQVNAARKYSGKVKTQEILTLEETLDLVGGSKIINIEIKNGPIFYPEIEEKALDVIKNYNIVEKVIISSFNHYTIKKIKTLAPDVKCGIIYMAGLYQPWKYAKTVGAGAVHPFHLSITEELITDCQKNDIKVNLFGVNKEEMLARAIKANVDMIITDFPDTAVRLRDKLKDKIN